MKRLLCCVLLGLFLLMGIALAENTVQLPDQYLSCVVYGGCSVQRYPGTQIMSLTEDAEQGIFSTFTGALNFDYPGEYTVYLVEYNTDTETTYRTTVHVTVSARDPKVEWVWDKSSNSAQTLEWIAQKGNIFAIGQTVSFRHTCTIDGVAQKVVYSSNDPGVATVDENGLVTMRGAGRACILMRAEGTDEASSNFVLVHDGEAWTNTWGEFWPEDSAETLNIYKEPDTSSTVLAVKKKLDTDNFYVLSRGEEWSRVTYNGVTGYAQTGRLHFSDGFEGAKPEKEAAPASTQSVSSSAQGVQESTQIMPGSEAAPAPQKSTGSQGTSAVQSGGMPDQVGSKVKVLTPGIVTSVIQRGEERTEVPTASLGRSKNVPEDKAVAVIYAPKTGQCSLRTNRSDKSKLLKQCKAGTVVLILQYDTEHCLIDYKGTEGYVKTACLKFYGTDTGTIGIGMLTYNGRATGNTTINVRNAPEKTAFVIADWETGTRVTVFAHENGWYEIEYRGLHGYVMEKYLTMKSETPVKGVVPLM